MVYNSSIEAVKELILVAENGGYVSWISDKDSRLINGLDYCLVEVTCRSGAQYRCTGLRRRSFKAIQCIKRYRIRTTAAIKKTASFQVD